MSVDFLVIDSESGAIYLKKHRDTGSVEVLHADPVVEIRTDLLEGELLESPYVRFHDRDYIDFIGHNLTVVYRICERIPARNTYMLRWPD